MNLNRAQRRAAKYKRPQYEKVISLTPLIDEFTIFDTPQRILDEIANDRLSINQDDVPVFIDNSGHWQEVVPCLGGWIVTWERILIAFNDEKKLSALNAIHMHLHNKQDIPQEAIRNARDELNYCRMMFRTHDRKKIQEIAKTSQIAIMLGTS
jgi:hypothetical protein